MSFRPIESCPPGTVLPFDQFPMDPMVCPWCDTGKVYRKAQGLRGHAMGAHGIRWEETPWDKLSPASKSLIQRGFDPKGLSNAEQLLPWMMVGIAMIEVQGMNFEQAAKKLGRQGNAHKLMEVAGSAAGLSYSRWLKEKFSDPSTAARFVIQAQALDATVSFLTALEWAKEAHDYDAVHRMTKDLLKNASVFEQEPSAGPTTINIVFSKGEADLEPITVEADYEIVMPKTDD